MKHASFKIFHQKNTIIFCLLFLLFIKCSLKKDALSNDEYTTRLQKDLTIEQVNSIDSLVKQFDLHLKKKYPTTIEPEIRIKNYLHNLISSYQKNDFKSLQDSNTYILPVIKSFKNNGLLKEIWIPLNSKYIPLDKVKKWSDSIEKIEISSGELSELEELEELEIIETPIIEIKDGLITNSYKEKVKDQINIKYQLNFHGLYYYALYKASSNSDSKIKEYISSRIYARDITPLLPLISIDKSFDHKEINNTLLKIILVTEFVLPIYLNEEYIDKTSLH